MPQYAARRTQPSRKLEPYVEWLRQVVAIDAQRPKAQRRTAKALHAELKRQGRGYDGAYSRVTDLLRAWRQASGTALCTRSCLDVRVGRSLPVRLG